MFGAIEAGGTKFVCGMGTGPDDLDTIQIPTTLPEETTAAVIAYFRGAALGALGIGSFGPIDLHPDSPSYGHITSTPKVAWRNYNLLGAIKTALRAPVGFDTDVNAAALGEARWGAAQGLTDFIYLTVGTGVGGGGVVNGKALHGTLHPEMGHIRIPHDRTCDPFAGACPYHGDCLEGLACGPAIEARWGLRAEQLPEDHPAWTLEAHYLALALATWACTLSPQRIILGGGVMQQGHLLGMIRRELAQLLNGYIDSPDVVAAQLGSRAGILGALALAEQTL
ncbi:MAG TPA: ROK family protein [Bryobacteraceae bacterium]|nr:ROK family protein [Bryobacteraceae bacterium]